MKNDSRNPLIPPKPPNTPKPLYLRGLIRVLRLLGNYGVSRRIYYDDDGGKNVDFRDKINYIHDHPEIYLERDRKRKGWICPICGSGSGKHGTGMTESKRVKGNFTCWAGSCFGKMGKDGRCHGDIIDMIQAKEGLTNAQAIRRAFDIYGLY